MDMMTLPEALAIVRKIAHNYSLPIEDVPLVQSVGRVCTEEVLASIDVQPFDNAAMDGFAIMVSDLECVGDGSPSALSCIGAIAAGSAISGLRLHPGSCFHVMTGAPLPEGTEAVVPIEQTQREGKMVFFYTVPRKGEHVRHAGEDFQTGEVVLQKNTQIQSQHIMPLATLGIGRLTVYRKPRVAFLTTGEELVTDFDIKLKDGQIYNSNLAYAMAAFPQMGVDCIAAESLPDEPSHFVHKVQALCTQGVDIIISSGAVSAGKFDFIRGGLETMVADILFHKVRMRPGKPNLFARLPSGVLYFGLPGNPAATAVGLRFLVLAAVRAMTKQEIEQPIFAISQSTFDCPQGLHFLLKARVHVGTDAICKAEILTGQESFKTRPFLSMNAWASIPEAVRGINPGDAVDCFPEGLNFC